MKFKYTLAQEESLNGLIRFLKKDTIEAMVLTQADALQVYHHFCWFLVKAQYHVKWENPIKHFLWVKVLCSNGLFLSVQDVTSILARLKYFCCLATLYEGLFNNDRNLPQDVIMSVLFQMCALSEG
ncbi:hypothetical protein JVT61DRAFT_14910 [Boletus reticuloceps]|uniref:Uncharacterized protein n=1 Tax=Boletus reticuloceps TaxID=495285 RepID=A0A8I2YCJ8_9AGAM|nr:hypothetical protein JVT61DRAFT_14910 [Boletus reticuloceps]